MDKQISYEVQMSGYDGGWEPVDATGDPLEAVLMARNDCYEHQSDIRIMAFETVKNVHLAYKVVYYADYNACTVSLATATQQEIAAMGGYYYNGDRVIMDGELMTGAFRSAVIKRLTEINSEGL